MTVEKVMAIVIVAIILFGVLSLAVAVAMANRNAKGAADVCPVCNGERRLVNADLTPAGACYACKGTGKRR